MKTIKTINGIEQLLDKCFEEGITNNNEIAEILYNQLVVVPKEKILCAANYYNDCQTYKNQPINISKGFVICGYRHNHVNSIIEKIYEELTNPKKNFLMDVEVKGFLTNTNRFVNRKEAYKIAFEADQIIGPNKGCPENEIGLTSEDLY